MLKILLKKWNKNKGLLEEKLRTKPMNYQYKDLVKLTFDTIYNSGENDYHKIRLFKTIGGENYSGDLVFMLSFGFDDEEVDSLLLTYVKYGSCCGCDTLQRIVAFSEENDKPNESQLKDLMMLCKDIITNTVKPFNKGWNYKEGFDEVEYEGEQK